MLSNNSTVMHTGAILNWSASNIGREVYPYLARCIQAVSAHSQAKKRERDSHRRSSMILSCESLQSYIYEKCSYFGHHIRSQSELQKSFGLTVSQASIYQYIYVQTKVELKKELTTFLRQRNGAVNLANWRRRNDAHSMM